MDYLQLLNERTHIYNLKYKMLTESKNAFECAEKNLFCKIVTGDNHNIPVFLENVVLNQVEKLFSDQDEFIKKLNQESCNEEYQRNKLLVDFNLIPLEYVNQLKSIFKF